jgi:ABC-2 type transport system ATP-binding protein
VLVTTHDLAGVEGIADRVGIMTGGRLVLDEPLDGIKERFRRLRFVRREDAGDDAVRTALEPMEPAAVRLVGQRVDAVVGRARGEAVAAVRELAVSQVELEPLSLEEIFVALCGDDEGGV